MTDAARLAQCWMGKEPFHQCCCKCRFHLQDFHYCQQLPKDFVRTVGGCGCGEPKGWICAPPGFEGKAHSGWPEHSIGCEMYMVQP